MIRIFYSVKQKLIEYCAKNDDNNVNIYMFRRVTESEMNSLKNISITRSQFIDFIDTKINMGMEFVSLDYIDDLKNINESIKKYTSMN